MQFVPLEVTPTATASLGGEPVESRAIRIELRRGSAQLMVSWPVQDAAACSAWLRQLCTGLLVGST
jgi:hypothetical protein